MCPTSMDRRYHCVNFFDGGLPLHGAARDYGGIDMLRPNVKRREDVWRQMRSRNISHTTTNTKIREEKTLS